MSGARAEVAIDKPADEVWRRIGNFADLSWIPNATPVRLDGEIRTFQLGHSTVKHRLLSHDDAGRTYTYALVTDHAPDPAGAVGAIEATLSVTPVGPTTATVTWTSETDERRGSSQSLGAFFQRVLDHVKSELQDASKPRDRAVVD